MRRKRKRNDYLCKKIEMRIPKSKRLRGMSIALAVNFITVWAGMYLDSDLTALGTCLSLINAPLYIYIMGDSYRPSV